MLDFRSKKPPRTYLGQREQRRLLTLVIAVGLVIWMTVQAARPGNWRWLVGGAGQEAAPAAAPAKPDPDTRLRPPGDNVPDAFLAQANVAQPVIEEPQTKRKNYFPGVKPDYLRTVRDNTVLGAENDAWYHLLEVLSKTDEKTLEKASQGRVGFVQLYNQPNEYRGQLVTVHGTIHRVHLLPAGENIYGIEEYYQLWLQPEGSTSPIVVYALQLPDQFPTGMKVEAECQVTGFFYKLWAYKAADAIRVAPLMLARTVRWQKPAGRAPPPEPQRVAPYLAIGIVLGAVVVTLLVAVQRRSAARRRAEMPDRLPTDVQHAELSPSVDEQLKKMGR